MIEINPGLLLAQLVTFLIAVFILWKAAWKPLSLALSKRKEKIEKDLALIEKAYATVKRVEEEYRSLIEVVETEADHIMEERKEEAEKQYQRTLNEAQDAAEKIRQKAELQMEKEREQKTQEIAQEIVTLSLILTERLLKQTADKQFHERLFQEAREQIRAFQRTNLKH